MRSIYSQLSVQALWLRVTASFLAGLVAVLAAGALVTFWRVASHNQGAVVAGEVYRTAQLNGNELRQEIEKFHLKSVVNLRGENSREKWYVEELAVCREMGVVHADVRLSARHLPPPDQLARLIADYHSLPQPMLIHCNAGSDRTGFAGSIYLIERKGLPIAEATDQGLSWRFGHFPLYPYFEMNEFFDLFREENPQHRSLGDWAVQDYPEIYAFESTETKWHEMLEPFESLAGIPYWREAQATRDVAVPGQKSGSVAPVGPDITDE